MASKLQVARLFADGEAFLNGYIEYLSQFYKMKHFTFRDEKVDEYQIQYCKRVYGFILIIPYAVDFMEPSIFLTWTFSNQRLAWDAPSSGLGVSYIEPRTSAKRIFERYLPKANILTATPIASIENTFIHENETVRHKGLVYACATRDAQKLQENNPDLRGLFVPTKKVA